jgi:hypothetical protein
MAKNNEQHTSSSEAGKSLPLIPVATRKQGKKDTPYEKEARRFNRLIKELHEYETHFEQQQKSEEEYDRLYQTRIVPLLVELGKEKYKLAELLDEIFNGFTFSKAEKRVFVELILSMLREINDFVPESHEMLRTYLNLHVQLLTKKNKADLKNVMEENGLEDISMEDFDIKDLWQQHADNFTGKEQEEPALPDRKKSLSQLQEETDINSLYRELVKKIHPDLEQDEQIRNEKEQIMKQVIDAKEKNDLHAMLVLKSRAGLLSGRDNGFAEDIEQLKRYNRQLSQKLNHFEEEHTMRLFEQISTDPNGFLSMQDHDALPDERIKQQIKDIKNELREVRHDMKNIRTPEDVRQLIAEYNDLGRDTWL